MMENDLMTILQLADSGFPTGGFSHSQGLESMYKHGLANNLDDVKTFTLMCLENTATQCLPFLREAHRESGDLDRVIRLDSICEACLSNHVANRASYRQGRSLLENGCKIFAKEELCALYERLNEGGLRGHYVVVFGFVCAVLGIDENTAVCTFMSGALRTIVASAVRMGNLGAMEGQKLQYEIQQTATAIIDRYRHITVDKAHIRHPVQDILQNAQDTLFSKLFYS